MKIGQSHVPGDGPVFLHFLQYMIGRSASLLCAATAAAEEGTNSCEAAVAAAVAALERSRAAAAFSILQRLTQPHDSVGCGIVSQRRGRDARCEALGGCLRRLGISRGLLLLPDPHPLLLILRSRSRRRLLCLRLLGRRRSSLLLLALALLLFLLLGFRRGLFLLPLLRLLFLLGFRRLLLSQPPGFLLLGRTRSLRLRLGTLLGFLLRFGLQGASSVAAGSLGVAGVTAVVRS